MKKSSLSTDEQNQFAIVPAAPLITSYNDKIRPLLDAVDKLRHLNIMEEGIQLPTIVVVGDQSSGKSSVLESLACISLPRGQGICTRVPLIMRLQHHSTPKPELFLEYKGKTVSTDEVNISQAISKATDEIAGTNKGISNTPLTLIVRKSGVPDLTMVDLPGITRIAVGEQPQDIYEQISNIIMEYISPEESIILNVLPANVDFATCESIRMSQIVDKTGSRTLAVVTKCDKSPEGLLEKVTADDVHIGLGYVCVRNRVGDESYEEARMEEAKLFKSNPLLDKIDKSIVGIPVLAQKLVQIQANTIARCLPEVVKKINEKLAKTENDFKKLPRQLSTVADAMTAFMVILNNVKESLTKILLKREFDEYPNDTKMHGTARLAEMLKKFHDVQLKSYTQCCQEKFLMEEIRVLEEMTAIELPNFLPKASFVFLLQKKVQEISKTPIDFVQNVWNYIEEVVGHVVFFHSGDYPQLQSIIRRAVEKLISKMRGISVDRVEEIIETEMLVDYTCSPDYMSTFNSLIVHQSTFIQAKNGSPTYTLPEHGTVEVGHLRGYSVEKAFDMNARLTAYWKILRRRIVDCIGLHIVYSVKKLVQNEMLTEIVHDLMSPTGCGVERLLEETPSVASKREKLSKSIKLLKDSKEVVSNIMHCMDAQ